MISGVWFFVSLKDVRVIVLVEYILVCGRCRVGVLTKDVFTFFDPSHTTPKFQGRGV